MLSPFLKSISAIFLFIFSFSFSPAQKRGWNSIGPFITPTDAGASYATGIGRINCLTFHPDYKNNKTIYAGAPTGGLYISRSNGQHWDYIETNMSSVGISDIAFDKTNPDIIYLASGDRDAIPDKHLPDGGTEFSQSRGIYFSYDGGKSFFNSNENWNKDSSFWTYPSYKNLTSILPLSSGKVLSSLYFMDRKKNSTMRGMVFLSTDQGRSWELTLDHDSGFFRELISDPTNDKIIYAAGTKIYFSEQEGTKGTWKEVKLKHSSYSRIELASSKSSEGVYALACPEKTGSPELYIIQGNKAKLIRVFPSLFSGETRFCYILEAMQTNKDVLFFGNIGLFRSENLGPFVNTGLWYASPSDPQYMHADVHALRAAPDSSVLYSCHDGGISRSYDLGKTWQNISNNLDVSKMYRLSCSQQTNKVMAGTQDAGTMVYDKDRFPNTSWGAYRGGDGGECIISRFSDSILLHTDGQNNMFAISTDSGKHWRSATPRGEKGDFLKPLKELPHTAGTFFIGYHDVHKSTDFCKSWKKISDFAAMGIDKGRKLVALEVSESNPDVIYAAYPGPVWNGEPSSLSKHILKTVDGGNTWTDITPGLKGLAWTQIKAMAIDPSNSDIIYIGFTGSWVFKVMRSVDGGITWSDFSEGLTVEDGVNSILCVGKQVYIGTYHGVFTRRRNAAFWKPFNKGLPNVPIYDLDYSRSQKLIRAATNGRGCWQAKAK